MDGSDEADVAAADSLPAPWTPAIAKSPHMAFLDDATALLDSLPDAEPDHEPDIGLAEVNINDTALLAPEAPPEGLEARTGHAIHQGEPKPAEGHALDWAALEAAGEPPARQWAEPGWIGMGHVTLLVGQGGIGKTLVAQQIASCFAVGDRLLSSSAHPLRTLMWACEDDHDELWRRQLAIAVWQGRRLGDYTNFDLKARAGFSNALIVSEFGRPMLTPLIAILQAQADEFQADVVVLDNVAQLYGAGENDRHAVTFFINALVGALRGCAIVLLAHPSKGAGSEFSGSTAWEAAARTRLYLGTSLPDQAETESPDDNVRYLARRKANYSGKDYRKFTYRDGVLVPDAPDLQGGMFAAAQERQAERVILAGLAKLRQLGKFPNDSRNSPRYLPRELASHKLSEGCPQSHLADAIARLLLAGKLTITEVGKDGSRRPITGLAEVAQSGAQSAQSTSVST